MHQDNYGVLILIYCRNQVQSQLIDNQASEFPIIHPNHVGRPYRCLYTASAHESTGNAPLQALLKLDLESG